MEQVPDASGVRSRAETDLAGSTLFMFRDLYLSPEVFSLVSVNEKASSCYYQRSLPEESRPKKPSHDLFCLTIATDHDRVSAFATQIDLPKFDCTHSGLFDPPGEVRR